MVTLQKKISENNLKADETTLKTENFSDNEFNNFKSNRKRGIKFIKNVKVESNESKNEVLREQNLEDTNPIFYFEEVTENYDIYTFQCPENLKIQDLENSVLNRCNLSEKMVVSFVPLQKALTIAFPSKIFGSCLINAPIQGHIIIQKPLETPKGIAKYTSIDDNWMTEYPNDIKVRHPLLGVDWEAYVNSSEKNIEKYKSLARNNKKRKVVYLKNPNFSIKLRKLDDKNVNTESIGTNKKKNSKIKLK